jgi:hypothetical protein
MGNIIEMFDPPSENPNDTKSYCIYCSEDGGDYNYVCDDCRANLEPEHDRREDDD